MEKKYYMISFGALLFLIFWLFVIQIRIGVQSDYSWLLLIGIGLTGIGSWFLGKKMYKETWFKEQQKGD